MSVSAGEVLDLVRSGAAATRADLRRRTGLSRTAVVSRVGQLVDAGLLLTGDELASTGGRPAGSLLLNPDAGTVVALAVGRSRHQLAVADLAGRELGGLSRDHEVGAGPDEVMGAVAAALDDLLAEHGAGRPVLGVGMSLPGTVDPERRVSVDSPVMAGWDGVPLAPLLAGATDAPLFLANDADVLARSERLGRPDLRHALVVKASTGLGLGILADHRVVSGQLGAAGEIGHTKVDAADARPCRCGDRGCLETVAAGWSLVARMAEEGRPVGHVRDLVALAQGGDPGAKQLLRDSGRRLGELLAVAINLLNPAAVVLGGDMAAAFEVYAAGVRESVYARASALATRDLEFLPAAYGDRAGVVGCAALALDHVLDPVTVDRSLRERRPARAGRAG